MSRNMTAENTTRIGTLNAVPRKRALRNDARRLSASEALGEIIDNAVDNLEAQRATGYRADHLTMEINVIFDGDRAQEVEIVEDSGGVSPENLLAFVQIGRTGNESALGQGAESEIPSIGVWGAGQKQAMGALGHDVSIRTRHWDSNSRYDIGGRLVRQVELRMDPDWWQDEDNWGIPAYEPREAVAPGRTYYRIGALAHALTRKELGLPGDEPEDTGVAQDGEASSTLKWEVVTAEELASIEEAEGWRDRREESRVTVLQELQEVYGDLLDSREDVTIRVNGVMLERRGHISKTALLETFAYPAGFEPSRHWFDVIWDAPERVGQQMKRVPHKLRMEIIVGLVPKADKYNAGVYMFGVPTGASGKQLGPRMFAQKLQDESVGYTEGPNSLLRKNDPTLGRLRIYVVFYGRSEDIPWGLPGSPVKKGYNRAHLGAEQIRQRIRDVARPYARFTSRAREIDIAPFSNDWEARKEKEKLNLIRRSAELKKGELDLVSPETLERVEALATRQFEPPARLVEWDHTLDQEQPPKPMPGLIEERAKEVVRELKGRDARLKQLQGDDPDQAVELLLESLAAREEGRPGQGNMEEEVPEASWEEQEQVIERIKLKNKHLKKLLEVAGTRRISKAIERAVLSYIGEEQEIPVSVGED